MYEQNRNLSAIHTAEKGQTATLKEKAFKIATANELVENISNESYLMKFLKEKQIANCEQVKIIDHYIQNPDREGIIIEAQEYNSTAKIKIAIDLKLGQPTIDQVHDALYGHGKDCDIKIIIYSDGYVQTDIGIPSADFYAVSSLISRLQEDNVPIILIEMDKNASEFRYDPYCQNWASVDKTNPYGIPSQAQFWAETFWAVYFDSFNVAFYDPSTTFEYGFRDTAAWGHLIYIDCAMDGEIELYWDKDGLRYEVKQCNDSDEYLKKTLDIIMLELENQYGKNNIFFENVIGKLPRLHIRFNSTPFSWIYNASPSEIAKFAGKVHENAWGLRLKIEETFEMTYQIDEH